MSVGVISTRSRNVSTVACSRSRLCAGSSAAVSGVEGTLASSGSASSGSHGARSGITALHPRRKLRAGLVARAVRRDADQRAQELPPDRIRLRRRRRGRPTHRRTLEAERQCREALARGATCPCRRRRRSRPPAAVAAGPQSTASRRSSSSASRPTIGIVSTWATSRRPVGSPTWWAITARSLPLTSNGSRSVA